MTCCLTSQVLTHYTTESKVYYADLGDAIRGRTITGVTGIASDDAALTLSGLTVVSSDTAEYDAFGNPITIEANTGVYWTMAGGTAGGRVLGLRGGQVIRLALQYLDGSLVVGDELSAGQPAAPVRFG